MKMNQSIHSSFLAKITGGTFPKISAITQEVRKDFNLVKTRLGLARIGQQSSLGRRLAHTGRQGLGQAQGSF